MTVFALSAQSGGGQVAEIARTFGVDWPHLLAQVVSFAIVCVLLYRFAYQPVLRMLDERRKTIALGLANTEKINAALANIEAQRQSVLEEARAESARLIADARDVAARLRQQEAERATAEGGEIVRKARDAAGLEHARMLAELRQEVGRLVVQTTTAVVSRVLTPEDHRRLAEETSRQLAASTKPGRVH